MYRGINTINVDDKGRIALPTRLREDLTSLVVTIDTEEHCLLLYPLHEWNIIEEKIENLPSFNPQVRRIQRLIIGHATELNLDANGRVVLPALLRDYARLEKQAMLVGQGRKFEIWSGSLWEQKCREWINSVNNHDELPAELKSMSL